MSDEIEFNGYNVKNNGDDVIYYTRYPDDLCKVLLKSSSGYFYYEYYQYDDMENNFTYLNKVKYKMRF